MDWLAEQLRQARGSLLEYVEMYNAFVDYASSILETLDDSPDSELAEIDRKITTRSDECSEACSQVLQSLDEVEESLKTEMAAFRLKKGPDVRHAYSVYQGIHMRWRDCYLFLDGVS